MPVPLKTTKLAVIGCGYWGKNLVRNFASLGTLAAIADHNKKHTDALSVQFSVPAAEFEHTIQDPEISAIAIATPGPSHFDLAMQVLQAGKHVFVEKPMAMSVKEAEILGREAERQQRILMVGHVLRYHTAFRKLEELAQAGELGRIRHVTSTRFNMGKILSDEDAVWALAPHDISMVLAMLGPRPEHVTAWGDAFLRGGIADMATLRLEYPNNVSAKIRLSWMHPYKEHKLTVIGEKGMAVFDDTQGWDAKLTLYRPELDWNNPAVIPTMPVPQKIALQQSEPLLNECEHFLSCINTGRQPVTNHHEGLNVIRILEQASKALDLNNHPLSPQQRAFS